MNKKFMLTALIVFTALVASNEGFTSGIVHALGWKLANDLLGLEITRLASSASQATYPSISFLSLVTRFLLV